MSNDQIAQIIYLGILAVVFSGSYIAANQKNLGKTLQQAIIWALIFFGAVVSVGLWDTIKTPFTQGARTLDNGQIVIPQAPDSHYYLTLRINNEDINFVVDTGASQIVLTQDDAQKIGLNPDQLAYTSYAFTANGRVQTAPVILGRVELEDLQDINVPAVVNQGSMSSSLLGMSYLQSFSQLAIRDGRLYLSRN